MISKEPQYYDWQQNTAINNSSEQLRDDITLYIRHVIPNHNTSDDVFRSMISKYSRLPSLQLLLGIL